jgi:hypothetical protein
MTTHARLDRRHGGGHWHDHRREARRVVGRKAGRIVQAWLLPRRRRGSPIVRRHSLHRAGLPRRRDEGDALLLQQALHTADGEALAVEEYADAAQEVHVLGPIIAPAAAALHRPDLREARLPEAQHVLRQIEGLGDLADGAKRVGRLHPPNAS